MSCSGDLDTIFQSEKNLERQLNYFGREDTTEIQKAEGVELSSRADSLLHFLSPRT